MIGLGISTKTWEGIFNLKKKQQQKTSVYQQYKIWKDTTTLPYSKSIWETKYAPQDYNPKYYYDKYDSLGALMK